MIQLQNVGTQFAPPPGGLVISPAKGSLLIRGVQTAKVQVGDFDVVVAWDGELFDGRGVLPEATPEGGGPFVLQSGELVIQSATKTEATSAAYIAAAVPVVVQTGNVKAGSIGTRWLVICDTVTKTPATWIVLVADDEKRVGRVEVMDVADATNTAYLSNADHFLELPNHQLSKGTFQAHLSKRPALELRVQQALARTVWPAS
jgi:hypothetical protein